MSGSIFTRLYFHWIFPFKSALRIAIASSIMGVVVYFISSVLPGNIILNILLSILAGTILYFILIGILGEIKRREIEDIVKLVKSKLNKKGE